MEATRRPTLQARRALMALAESQGGYFTAKQAAALGYGPAHLAYHVGRENVERVEHGLYRLAGIPLADFDSYVRLSLWSRNRDDEPQAIVSHETALFLHEMSDILPDRTHLTVPPRFRKAAPPGCVLHTGRPGRDEVEARAGFRLTTPLRTLLDVAASETLQEHIDQAVADALDRGLVSRAKLAEVAPRNARLRRAPRVRDLLANGRR